MADNRGVAYMGTGKVEVQPIPFPELVLRDGPGVHPDNIGREAPHGAILKIVSTNICGSDQHMVRGRTTAPEGLILGHEITGEVIEIGRDVEFIKKGDLVSVPFNIACGRCRNCKEGHTGVCLNVNPERPGSAYGYVDMGGWVGGQAEYALVPYADWNLLKFPDRDQAMAKIKDLTMLSDIFPTGFHGAYTAGVGPGSTVYVAGAGPVGLACAHSAQFLGAAVVIVGDINPDRLKQARSFGCETVDLRQDATLPDQIEQILGIPEVDAAVDCVGFEARGHGASSDTEMPATVLNSIMEVTRAGAKLGIPGLYVTGDPGAADEAAQQGSLSIRIGLGWAKSHVFTTGQCPVMKYHRQLMQAILHDRVQIAKAVNATVVTLDEAPQGYMDFDKGASKKYIIDPHGLVAAA
ncbi:MAG: formaldehyde dehydrogenase, glutathione-independent [Actinomycetota bacterium]|nr:formaldehyde dehydrogenase, glutathione-independent [Actinomycetota bacterium]